MSEFTAFTQRADSIIYAYPCTAAGCDGGAIVCRCPFNQTTCDFNTDLVNADGHVPPPIYGVFYRRVYPTKTICSIY